MTATRFQLVTLDGDGTLWDFESAMLNALERTAQQMTRWNLQIDGREPSRDDLLADREAVGREHAGAGMTMERLRWLALERSLTRAGVPNRPDLVETLYRQFMEIRHEGVRLFDDALSALLELRRQRKVALVTNGNTDLRRLGMDVMFDIVTVAQECQLWKPDPRIFQLPLAQLRLLPAQAIHVGDHQRHDVHGASAAGLCTVWVNRRSALQKPWCAPDAEIQDLSELPTVLDQLERASADNELTPIAE
jgi:2-haloalkanoic acid dehalogenase type II